MYGSVPPNNTAVSTYTIDISSSVTFVNPNLTQYTSGQLLYQSPVLQDGPHVLSVNAPDTVVGDAATQFFFDFLTYVPSSNVASPSSMSHSTSSSKSQDLKVILPAVLIPCLLCIAFLALGLFVQRKRMLTALQQRPTPYRDTENGEGSIARIHERLILIRFLSG